MNHSKQELEKSNVITVERINAAVAAGVKIKVIADESDITYFRLASVVNVESYRYKTSFTMEEIKRIHKSLDSIKSAL